MASKKYILEDQPPMIASEPMATYLKPGGSLVFFSTLSPQDVEEIQISGKALSTFQEQTTLASQLLAEAIGISKSKYYDLIQYDSLDSKTIDAMADFATLWQKGLEAFDGEKALLLEWLHTRNENLGGIQPITLLGSRIGRRTLERAFMQIEYSVYG